jgi:class 3 adenylate cyclase
MFADIVNFTHLSEEMSPNDMVSLLNDIFSAFDILAERFEVEKIKTIGDAYMVAGGLTSRSGQYVDAVAVMALHMQEFVSQYVAPNGERLALRVGIATGPVVAGVIGHRKFSYDLWGDTVNIASRMCTEAIAGHIQVDSVTYRRLHNRFNFDEPYQIQVKGKGPMQVYNLRGKLGGDPLHTSSPVEGQHRG